MTNNDVFRRMRFILNYGDDAMIDVFKYMEETVTRPTLSAWLKRDENPEYIEINDVELGTFFNALIIKKRGRQEGVPLPIADDRLSNNEILKKIKIAFNYRAEDMLEILELANFGISKHELSAFFRKLNHKHYRPCKDQLLRNFLQGMKIKYRSEDISDNAKDVEDIEDDG